MIDQAGVSLAASKPGMSTVPLRTVAGRGRRVAGKTQLSASALGMYLVLAALWAGKPLAAGVIFLLTIGMLEVMFQRALADFRASARARRIQPVGGDLRRSQKSANDRSTPQSEVMRAPN